GGERVHAGAVAGGVDAPHRGAGDAVGLDVPGVPYAHPGGLEPEIGGPGDPADGDQHVAAGDLLAGGERHHDPVVGAPRGLGTGAASASVPGSTLSREETRVTSLPRARCALAKSAPVTPEPTTIRCSGRASSSYSWVQFRIRSPSQGALSSSRGRAPTASRITSASRLSIRRPSPASTSTRSGPSSRPVPSTTLTPASTRLERMSTDWAAASSRTRALTAAR